jgi:TPR repeat protein
MPADAVRRAGIDWRSRLAREAESGAAQAQYDLAVSFECGQDKDLNQARRWYKAAAVQGHAAARERLTGLDQPLPEDARDREHEKVRRDINCLSELQKASSKVLNEMDENAKKALRTIKPG